MQIQPAKPHPMQQYAFVPMLNPLAWPTGASSICSLDIESYRYIPRKRGQRGLRRRVYWVSRSRSKSCGGVCFRPDRRVGGSGGRGDDGLDGAEFVGSPRSNIVKGLREMKTVSVILLNA